MNTAHSTMETTTIRTPLASHPLENWSAAPNNAVARPVLETQNTLYMDYSKMYTSQNDRDVPKFLIIWHYNIPRVYESHLLYIFGIIYCESCSKENCM